MNYVFFDSQGVARHYYISPENVTESFIPDHTVSPAGDYVESDLPYLRKDTSTGVITRLVDIPVLAAPWQIRDTWLQLEKEPIQIGPYLIDCDPVSALRMDDALAYWDFLPVIEGQFEDVDGVRKITWSMDNGKVLLSKPELQQVFDSMVSARAVRAATLFSNYQRIKALPEVPLTYILDKTNWFK